MALFLSLKKKNILSSEVAQFLRPQKSNELRTKASTRLHLYGNNFSTARIANSKRCVGVLSRFGQRNRDTVDSHLIAARVCGFFSSAISHIVGAAFFIYLFIWLQKFHHSHFISQASLTFLTQSQSRCVALVSTISHVVLLLLFLCVCGFFSK